VMTDEIAWGRTDVRIVVAKGKALAVQVVRASDGSISTSPVLSVALR